MFVGSRLLVRSTIISSAGVCLVRFAKSHSTGSEGDSSQPSRFPRVSGKIERSIPAADLYKGSTPVKTSVTASKMDYKDEADAIAQKAYSIYKSTDWKVAKASVSHIYNNYLCL